LNRVKFKPKKFLDVISNEYLIPAVGHIDGSNNSSNHDKMGDAEKKSILMALPFIKPNYDAEKYTWEKIGGPKVEVESTGEKKISFIVPNITEETIFEFKLTVTVNEKKFIYINTIICRPLPQSTQYFTI
jgi:hypothetical protein